jgi:hypothetical protein
LDAIEHRFRLLCAGPEPMSVDGRRLGHGLPRRRIGLHELSAILMHPSCSLTARDEAWRLLVARARTGKECWRVGAVGVAMPGLRFRAYLLSRTCTGDIHAALVAEFLAQLASIDLSEPNVVNGLLDRAMSAARGALRRAYHPYRPDQLGGERILAVRPWAWSAWSSRRRERRQRLGRSRAQSRRIPQTR